MRRDDEDDRSGGAGGSSWVERIVIPDDISELDAEIRALHRERRAQRRRARLRRLTGSGRTGGPLLLVALLLIAGVAGLLVMFQPRRTSGNVAPLGTTAVLAALLGLNIGSGLTWTGSLANLLWRRTLVRAGRPVGSAAFHRVSLVITPVSLAAAVAALWLTVRLAA